MLFLPALLRLSVAWWGGPHKVVATIGEQSLSQEKREYVEKLLSLWKGNDGTIVSLSTWQDNIKSDGVKMMSQWHFTNEPYVAPGFTLKSYSTTYNITTVLTDTINSLFMESTTSPWAIAFHFRNLIHFVGDIHQPLHVTAGYSADYPYGDRGGNSVILQNCPYGDACNNLHMMWDSALLELQEDDFSVGTAYSEFEANVTRIKNSLDLSKEPEAGSLDPRVWVSDAYEQAAGVAYAKLNNYTITPSYIAEGQKVCDRLIALAGHRLSLLFAKFFEERGFIDLSQSQSVTIREIVAWCIDAVLLVVVVFYAYLILKLRSVTEYGQLAEKLSV